jgi:hypothetical protein
MADLQDELRTTAEVGKLDPSAPPPVPAPESDEHPDEPPGDDQDAELALALLRDPDADPLDRAHALLTAHPVADGYSGLPWALRHLPWYDLELGESTVDTDVPRMRRGHVGALFWALHLPDGLAGDRAVGATLEIGLADGLPLIAHDGGRQRGNVGCLRDGACAPDHALRS